MIGNSVTSIGSVAFSGCSSLANITITDSVTSVGRGAFEGTAYYQNDDNWENDILYLNNCLIKANVGSECVIRESTTVIGDEAFSWCSSLTSVTIPNGVINIGNSAFSDCRNLISIVIPDSVTNIGDSAFSSCHNLKEVTIGRGVERIGSSAFGYCENLENISLPSNVSSIGQDAFKKCKSLQYINIPKGVPAIKGYTFESCNSLTSISIPQSVKEIGGWAFYDCSSLLDVYYDGTQDEWNNIDIYDFGNKYLNSATIHYQAISAHTKTTVSKDRKTFDVKPVNISAGNTVILALYDNGKFIEMQTEKYNGIDIQFVTDKSYTNAKVMVWESFENMKPVCQAEIVK